MNNNNIDSNMDNISHINKLLAAVENNNLARVKSKLSTHKIINSHLTTSHDLFRAALKNENNEILEVLLENMVKHEQDLRANNDELFSLAVSYSNLYMLKFLIREGVKVHARDDFGIRTSALNGDLNLVKFFISKGASISANNYEPLTNACLNNHLSVVQYLIEEGKHNLSQYNAALQVSIRNQHLDLTVYLLEERKKIESDEPYFFKNLDIESKNFIYNCETCLLTKDLDKNLPHKEVTRKQKI